MTSEHLKVVLQSARDSNLFCQLAEEFVRAELPPEIVRAMRMGRMTALQKPSGGVRGIVVGDIFRRVVSRAVAQQIAKQVEQATAPFQYALSTRCGTECVGHAIQGLTDLDPEATVLSVDGIGAFDLVSREAMMQGTSKHGGRRPFSASFHSPVLRRTVRIHLGRQ